MDLYFKDLTADAQKRILEEAGVTVPEEMNWDVFPLTQLCFGEDDSET